MQQDQVDTMDGFLNEVESKEISDCTQVIVDIYSRFFIEICEKIKESVLGILSILPSAHVKTINFSPYFWLMR